MEVDRSNGNANRRIPLMRKQKIYLETTLFNFCFDEDRGFAHTLPPSFFISSVKIFEPLGLV